MADDFDPDEIVLLLGCGVISLLGAWRWFRWLRPVSKLGALPLLRAPLYSAVVLGFALLWHVIWNWADPEIRTTPVYVTLVLLMGGAWLTLAAALFPWLGTGLRDDVFEARNPAAALALSGAVLGVLITFAGSNIGTGPSFWNNVFAGMVSTGALLALWLALALGADVAGSVSRERDLGAGIRLGAFLVAEGLILGRAIAGDWHSAAKTVEDFAADGWAGAALLAVAFPIERWLQAGRATSSSSPWLAGVCPAVLYLSSAAAWLIHLGWWEGAPR
jgi:uncharacterized membrane protein YjfL (UPF0719 family)